MPNPGKATVSRTWLICPACHNEVTARLTLDVAINEDARPGPDGFGSGDFETSLTGMAISHDCNKPVPR